MSAHTPGPWKFVQGCHVYAGDRIAPDSPAAIVRAAIAKATGGNHA
jgi:hypothetical protein